MKQIKEVFSRKHRAHCLNAVPGSWFKIGEHYKLEIVFTRAAPAFDYLFMGCVFNINMCIRLLKN